MSRLDAGRLRLDGKVCVITGGTSGIGEAAVELFADEGAKVVFCGRGIDKGTIIEKRVNAEQSKKKSPGECVFVKCDVTVESELKNVIDTAVSRFGGLDVLFNNAGGPDAKHGKILKIDSLTKDDVDFANWFLFGSVAMATKYASQIMKKKKRGSIINCSSIAALQASSGGLLYSPAKAAVTNFTKVSACALAPHGIRVNTISPAAIATPIFWHGSPGSGRTLSEQQHARRQAAVEKNIIENLAPLRIGRAGLGIDIAYAALYLATEESAWMTGQDLVIDAGMDAINGHLYVRPKL